MARKQSNPDNFKKPFPTALRTLMEERNTSQKDLADYLGKTRQAISLYCNGESSPDLETLVKIAQFFNTSTDYLLGVVSDPAPKPSAADELGLAPSIITEIKRYKEINKGFLSGLNIFLETTLPTGFYFEIYSLKSEILSELDAKLSTIETENAEHYRTLGKFQGDCLVMKELEDILIEKYPELEGRISVKLPSFNFRGYYDGIIKLFERCLDSMTGYSDFMEKGKSNGGNNRGND